MNILERPSPNFTPGRQSVGITGMVWHHTGGAFGPSLSWIQNPASQVSYHYMVDRNGTVYRNVAEGNIAWHAGVWDMNVRTVGICGETDGWTTQARDSFVTLARDISGRYKFPLNRNTVIRHREVPGHPGTDCPGSLPIDAWVALAAQGSAPAPAPKPPAPSPGVGREITVQPGDSLSSIAAWVGHAGQWQAIYDLNKAVIGPNPNLIKAGMRLHLPPGW